MIYVTAYRPSEMWPKGLPRLAGKYLTKILVQADVFRDDIRSMGYSGPVVVLPLIPPEPATTAGPTSRSKRVIKIGFVGRLVAQKNVDYLLAIANELKAAPLEFHIFGGGEDEDALRSKAAATSVNINFHGEIERHSVLDAIDSCDAIAVTSISEGQCLVALEALSRGKPLLATPVGALPEILCSGRFGVELPLNNEKYAAEKTWKLAEEIFRGEWSRNKIISEYSVAFSRDQILHDYRKHLQWSMDSSQQ
ncbi:MAG: glycosyltransferase [Porphyrobacter sp.]|nr:glycosyltransferase [Porphyrobacter sp.]